MTVAEMRDYLEGLGYSVDGMVYEEIEELAEAEGFEWSFETKKFEEQE